MTERHREKSGNCENRDHTDCAAMVECEAEGHGIHDCACYCHKGRGLRVPAGDERERIAALLDSLAGDPMWSGNTTDWREVAARLIAAGVHLTGDALDVERLAMATARVVGWTGALDYHREWAEKVAREYAATPEADPNLAPTEESSP